MSVTCPDIFSTINRLIYVYRLLWSEVSDIPDTYLEDLLDTLIKLESLIKQLDNSRRNARLEPLPLLLMNNKGVK